MKYSDRILNTPSSFIRDILKVTDAPDVISFAGGLPNPVSFPIGDLQESIEGAIKKNGSKLFQYSTTEGYLPLREMIAAKYRRKFNLDVDPEDVLITNGSQQALELLGKVILNKGDQVLMEEPGYLGAIQAFSLCEPEFLSVTLEEDGLDLVKLEELLKKNPVKLIYCVPNFQNPTGLTYSLEKRKAMRDIVSKYDVAFIEDDPYGELRFRGESLPYIGAGHMENSILLGTFSKTVTPGMRLGFLITKNTELMRHLVTAKQGSDLHTNIFTQYVIHEYLMNNPYAEHVKKIIALYEEQATAMLDAMEAYFPKTVSWTKPEGGMFIWVTLPEGLSALDVFQKAMEKKVAFVPGDPFYTHKRGVNTFRLNYTNATPDVIREGIKRLGSIL
ncbi:aminotransferase-like domain-containing protein [Oxalobacter formigenes]